MEELEPALAGGVFVSSMAIDALGAYYVRSTARGEAFRASIASAGIAVLGYVNLAAFLDNWKYAGFEIAGGVIGTYVVVKFDKMATREEWVI